MQPFAPHDPPAPFHPTQHSDSSKKTPKRDERCSIAAFAVIAAVFLGVLLTASHRLWRVLVVSIAAAMTHNYSFFAARVGALPRNVYWELSLPRFPLGGEKSGAVDALARLMRCRALLRSAPQEQRVSDGLRDIVP